MATTSKQKKVSAKKPVAKKAVAKFAPPKAKREEISSDLRKVALAHALRRLK